MQNQRKVNLISMHRINLVSRFELALRIPHFAKPFSLVKKCEVYILYFLKNAKLKVCLKRFNFLRLFTFVIRSIQIVNHETYLGCAITLLNWFCFISKKTNWKSIFFSFPFFYSYFEGIIPLFVLLCFAHNSNGVKLFLLVLTS